MDVSLRHWPIFMTGLLLGAAGTMSLGLHRPTQLELAEALAAARPVATAAATAPALAPTQAELEARSAELAEEKMAAAAQAFRAQEAQAAAAAPFAVAAAMPKPKPRRIQKEPDAPTEAVATAPVETVPPIAIAPATAPDQAFARNATSVMGAAPAEQVMPARGSAHAPEDARN